MSIRLALRQILANQYRHLPRFRGEGRLAKFLQDRLTNYGVPDECCLPVTMRNGTIMIIDLRSRMERHVFWRGTYEDDDVRLLASLLPPGAVMLDVGANIGLLAVPFCRLLQARGGKLYAFEPLPANFARLCENLRLNFLESVCEPFHMALGNVSGIAAIEMDDDAAAVTGNAVVHVVAPADGPDDGSGGSAKPWCPVAPVRVSTLAEWSACHELDRCDLIKIDIEGGEYSFFQAAGNFLLKHRPVVYCELNYCRMRDCRWTAQDLVELMQPWSYGMFYRQGAKLVAGCVGEPTTENVLLIPDERVGVVADRFAILCGRNTGPVMNGTSWAARQKGAVT
jgi:FkbM family methyltransferase